MQACGAPRPRRPRAAILASLHFPRPRALRRHRLPSRLPSPLRPCPASRWTCAMRALDNFVGRNLYGSTGLRLAAPAAQPRGLRARGGAAGTRSARATGCWCSTRCGRIACRSSCGTTSTAPTCASTWPTRRAGRSTRSAWRSTRRCVDPQGRELDMGSGYDEMTELSHPRLEAQHLASGQLTPAAACATASCCAACCCAAASRASTTNGGTSRCWTAHHVRRHFTRVE